MIPVRAAVGRNTRGAAENDDPIKTDHSGNRGRPYGWGVAEYATPEEFFGYDLITSAYQRDPQESKERMMQHLSSILPGASAQQLMKILKG